MTARLGGRDRMHLNLQITSGRPLADQKRAIDLAVGGGVAISMAFGYTF